MEYDLKELFVVSVPKPTWVSIIFRIFVYLLLLLWGVPFILDSAPMDQRRVVNSFWHLVNLPFHEAGHVFFSIFGDFIRSAGGSLGQLIIPLVCSIVLLIKTRDPFGSSASLWWFSESVLDLAPYINDARSLTLPLLGGNIGSDAPYGFHDWNYLLTEVGLLAYDQILASSIYFLGSIVMVCTLAWGGIILYTNYQTLKPKKSAHFYFDTN